jgi:Fe-S-cluster containining protein
MEVIRLMGGVGLDPLIPDPDQGMGLYKIHSCIKCKKCGICCTVSDPISIEPQDVERLSAHLGISIRKTIQKYATRVEVDGQRAWAMKRASPCIFLDEAFGLCKIHSARPIICRAFPHLSPRTVGGEPPVEWCPVARDP